MTDNNTESNQKNDTALQIQTIDHATGRLAKFPVHLLSSLQVALHEFCSWTHTLECETFKFTYTNASKRAECRRSRQRCHSAHVLLKIHIDVSLYATLFPVYRFTAITSNLNTNSYWPNRSISICHSYTESHVGWGAASDCGRGGQLKLYYKNISFDQPNPIQVNSNLIKSSKKHNRLQLIVSFTLWTNAHTSQIYEDPVHIQWPPSRQLLIMC